MAHARIGKITLKRGGAEVRLLHQTTPNLNGANWRGEIVKCARRIAEHDEPNSALVGYVVIGLFSDGAHSLGFAWDADRSPVPRRLMPSYVAELIREDLISG